MRKLRVALVAPTLEILGGQAVQASRLLRQWKGDAEVEAWLVPVNPAFPRSFDSPGRSNTCGRSSTSSSIFRRSSRRFAAPTSSTCSRPRTSSFLLAPFPAVLVARLLGRPVVLNYRSGQAPDHLARSRVARWTLRAVQRNVVPSRFLVGVFAGIRHRRERDPQHGRLQPLPVSRADGVAATDSLDAQLRAASTTSRARFGHFTWFSSSFPTRRLTLVGGGAEEARLRALVRELRLNGVTFTGQVGPDDIAALYDDHDIYLQSPDIDNMPTSVIEAFACGLPVVSTEAGGVPAILTHREHGLLAPLGDYADPRPSRPRPADRSRHRRTSTRWPRASRFKAAPGRRFAISGCVHTARRSRRPPCTASARSRIPCRPR